MSDEKPTTPPEETPAADQQAPEEQAAPEAEEKPAEKKPLSDEEKANLNIPFIIKQCYTLGT